MTAPLFVLKIKSQGEIHAIPYSTMADFFGDAGLRHLFDSGLVDACTIYKGADPLAPPLPKMLLTWDRLKDEIVSNGAALLREFSEDGL